MENYLKVTPEKLIETADQFAGVEANIRGLFGEMNNIVESFKTVWQGEAATGFTNRYKELTDDMERIFSMIREHSADLIEMAGEYKNAEEESVAQASALGTEAVS